MERVSLSALLYRYQPIAPEEITFKEKMLAFMARHKDCFERSLAIGHFTASCWLLNKTGDKALLLHHAKLDRWFQLGGHCDGDSDVLAVAIKEAQEESGIMNIKPISAEIFDIDIHPIPATTREQAHDHYDVRFLLQVTSDEDLVSNRESKELRWISKNRTELPTDSVSVIRMFNKWIDRK